MHRLRRTVCLRHHAPLKKVLTSPVYRRFGKRIFDFLAVLAGSRIVGSRFTIIFVIIWTL